MFNSNQIHQTSRKRATSSCWKSVKSPAVASKALAVEAMEASEEILLNSLANSGVRIPAGVSSVRDLTPASLFSLCFNALLLIDGRHYASLFPASLPEESMPDKVKICTELAHAFNKLGYNPELSFHKVPLSHFQSFSLNKWCILNSVKYTVQQFM